MAAVTQEARGHEIVLLGASNLTISLPLIVEGLRTGFRGPLDVFAALGHGRSFALWSRVMHRELPGIVGCGLWDALPPLHDDRPVRALITDIGNDILYGASVTQIADWVETCLQRLTARRAEFIMTLLPVESVLSLSPMRYHVARFVLFRGKGSSLSQMVAMVHELNGVVAELARKYGARVVAPPATWYGLDPIHIRRRQRIAAWRAIFSGWSDFSPEASFTRPSLRRTVEFVRYRPQIRRVLGRMQQTEQPILRTEGLTLSLY